jgi:hypothetical protein
LPEAGIISEAVKIADMRWIREVFGSVIGLESWQRVIEAGNGSFRPPHHNRTLLKRRALVTTDTEEKLMAAAAIMGLSRMPNQG